MGKEKRHRPSLFPPLRAGREEEKKKGRKEGPCSFFCGKKRKKRGKKKTRSRKRSKISSRGEGGQGNRKKGRAARLCGRGGRGKEIRCPPNLEGKGGKGKEKRRPTPPAKEEKRHGLAGTGEAAPPTLLKEKGGKRSPLSLAGGRPKREEREMSQLIPQFHERKEKGRELHFEIIEQDDTE